MVELNFELDSDGSNSSLAALEEAIRELQNVQLAKVRTFTPAELAFDLMTAFSSSWVSRIVFLSRQKPDQDTNSLSLTCACSRNPLSFGGS